MTQQRKQEIKSDFWAWVKQNMTTIIAACALSWQISSKVGPYAYYKVANTLDTIETTRLRSWETQRELSTLKVETQAINNRQDTSIKYLTQNTR